MVFGEDHNPPLTQKGVFFSIGSGILSAVLAFSLISGAPLALLLAYLAPFPLFLAGLGNGGKACVVAACSGVVCATLLGGALGGCIFAITTAFPSWMATKLILTSRSRDGIAEWFPIGSLLTTFSAYASVLFLITVSFFATGQESLAQMVSSFLASVTETVAPNLQGEHRELIVTQLSGFFPAMVLGSWLLMTFINAVLAQAVLSKSGKALRPSPRYSEMTLPDLSSWLFVACAVVTVVSSGDLDYIARNLTVVMAIPFFALGLSVIHSFAKTTRFRGGLLGTYYVLLLLSVYMVIPTVGLGLIEQWIGVRKKFATPSDNQEKD